MDKGRKKKIEGTEKRRSRRNERLVLTGAIQHANWSHRKRPGQNSSGLVNRTTIVKHLPYILAISFFFPLASFWVCSTPN